jgi:hypothetical protein
LLRHLQALNNPKDAHFEPSVTTNWEMDQIKLPIFLEKYVLRPYIRIGQSIVRVETDVIMLTHLLLYFSTSVPSAIYLFYNFNWIHGILHFLMQFTYMGSYTLLMHQHIHMRGVLNKKFALFDHLYPYITDPLMGHTWNSYFYHHVKHHHVEGNGPNDLSSTIRYQRDSLLHFLHYFGRFFFLVWADLPIYFVRTGKTMTGLKAGFWEFSNYAMLITLFNLHRNATICVFLMPLLLMRFGLMAGNWGQHAFVDDVEPDSDYRSSITLIDVAVSLDSPGTLRLKQILTTNRATASATTMVTTPPTTLTLFDTGVSTQFLSTRRSRHTQTSTPLSSTTLIISC